MDKNAIEVEKRMMGVPLQRGGCSFHAGSGRLLCRPRSISSCLTARVAVLACVLWGSQVAVAADGAEKQARIRQTAEQQRDIREEALRTVAVLKELSEELVSNRFRDPALTKNVSGVENALEKAGNEYMEQSEQNLKALLDLAGDAALKGKLDEVLRLQDLILNMLTQIRNARIAADKSRLQRLLEVALRNQRGVMERTKAILFNPQERVPGGKAPESLSVQEKERLNQVAALQGMTHHSVQKAVAEFLAASAIQDAKMPQQAEAARKIHAYLAQAKVVDKAAQAQSDLELNRSTQALVTENEVIQILELAIGSLAKVAGDLDNKLSELAQEREEVADLLAKQREIRKDTEALPATAKAEAMKALEAREDRLAKTAEELKDKADEKTLARATMEQVKKAMERAEEKLSKGEKAPALEEMKAAEKGMEAALMALEKQMEDVAAEKKESAEAAEKKADELLKEAEAAAKMSKDLEAAAKKEEEIRKETQQASDEKKDDAQTPSADEKKDDAQTASADEKKDAQTPSADEKKDDAQTPSAEQQQKMAQIAAEQETLQQQVKAMQQSADQQQKKSMPESMQEASRQMEQAQQAMQQTSEQLKQNQPEDAKAPAQAAQKSLEQAADTMKKMEQALRQMEKAQRDAATAAKLNEMAEKQAGLQQQADKPQDPSSMQDLKKAQQDLANELSQMRKKEPGLGPKAQEAEDAMKKAQSQLEAEEKAMGSGQPPPQPPKDGSGMPAAKKEMMNAQAALQQMASQMNQSAQQAQQAQQAQKDSKPSSEKDSKQAEQGAKGIHNRGDPTVKLGAGVNSRGWEAEMSERDRVKFGQNADRVFPPEYSKLLEGYYRRLATDK